MPTHTHMHIRPALLIQRVCRPHERTSCSSDSPKRDSRRTSGTRKRRPRLIRGSSVFVARRPVTGGFWTASLRRSRGQSSCTEEQARPQQPRLPTVPCPWGNLFKREVVEGEQPQQVHRLTTTDYYFRFSECIHFRFVLWLVSYNVAQNFTSFFILFSTVMYCRHS